MKIAAYIGSNPSRFKELVQLFLGNENRVTQRAAWVFSMCIDRHPHLLENHLKEIITNLRQNVHVAVTRNSLRVLQHYPLPEDLVGEVTDICFNFLQSGREPVAVKVFAMTILGNICEQEPGLKNELKLIIEDQFPMGSAGFKSRAGKVLHKLNKI